MRCASSSAAIRSSSIRLASASAAIRCSSAIRSSSAMRSSSKRFASNSAAIRSSSKRFASASSAIRCSSARRASSARLSFPVVSLRLQLPYVLHVRVWLQPVLPGVLLLPRGVLQPGLQSAVLLRSAVLLLYAIFPGVLLRQQYAVPLLFALLPGDVLLPVVLLPLRQLCVLLQPDGLLQFFVLLLLQQYAFLQLNVPEFLHLPVWLPILLQCAPLQLQCVALLLIALLRYDVLQPQLRCVVLQVNVAHWQCVPPPRRPGLQLISPLRYVELCFSRNALLFCQALFFQAIFFSNLLFFS